MKKIIATFVLASFVMTTISFANSNDHTSGDYFTITNDTNNPMYITNIFSSGKAENCPNTSDTLSPCIVFQNINSYGALEVLPHESQIINFNLASNVKYLDSQYTIYKSGLITVQISNNKNPKSGDHNQVSIPFKVNLSTDNHYAKLSDSVHSLLPSSYNSASYIFSQGDKLPAYAVVAVQSAPSRDAKIITNLDIVDLPQQNINS